MTHRVRVPRAPRADRSSAYVAARPVKLARRPAAPAHAIAVSKRSRPAARAVRTKHRSQGRRLHTRRWSLHGRRGQVSAIVTILGLLMVVSFIASYLSQTLPGQMRVNEANHNVQVENQIGQFSTLMHSASMAHAIGAVVTQPVSLGSAGVAPFAGPTASAISALSTQGSTLKVNFTVRGPLSFQPPGGWPAGGNLYSPGSKCSSPQKPNENPTLITCSGSPDLVQNLTNGSHWINAVGGANFSLQYTTNWSKIVINTTGGLYIGYLNFSGSHDNISITYTGGAFCNVTIYGNYDNVSMTGTGGGTMVLHLIGDDDSAIWDAKGTSSNFEEYAFGEHDNMQSNSSKGIVHVDYTGFNATNPISQYCPYGNLATTNTVSGTANTVQYNTTTIGNTSTTLGNGWTADYNITAPSLCPFFSYLSVPFLGQGASAGSFVIHLRNDYSPAADIAYDQGAVIYAQPGGIPTMINGPALTFANNHLSLWVPQFSGSLGAAQGVGTASLSFRLNSVFTLSLPTTSFSLAPGNVVVTVQTPFASAWKTYFNAQSAFAGDASCTPAGSAACKGPYIPGGALGTVTISIPIPNVASGIAFTIQVATFQVSVH